MLPAGTPTDIVQLLNTEITRAARTRDFAEPLAAFAIEVIAGTPDEFATYLKNETSKWAKVIRDR